MAAADVKPMIITKDITTGVEYKRDVGKKIKLIPKKIPFIYPIEKVLKTNYDIIRLPVGTPINICIYHVNTTGLKPFLQYLLYKMPSDKGDKMIFPTKRTKPDTSILAITNKFVKDITRQDGELKGYLYNRKGLFVYYYLKNINTSVKLRERRTQFWWVLIDEICNSMNCTNFPIDESVSYNFFRYPDLIYLKDSKNTNIDIPIAGYHGSYHKFIPFIAETGLKRSSILSMMGPYYYFGTYRKAIRYAGWTSNYHPFEIDGKRVTDDEGRWENGGIVRFAVFLGRMKVFLNHPLDPDDKSEIYYDKLEKEPHNIEYQNLVLKLHDHTGKWTRRYNSCYVGSALLDNGRYFMSNPEYVVKDFEQQTPLTYHYLDKTTLKRNWDSKYDKYYIK